MTESTEIPLLDLGELDLDDPKSCTILVDDFRWIFEHIGFAYVIGHGVDSGLIDSVFDASRRFHSLPLERKVAVELNRAHRGFIAANSSTDINSKLAEVTKPNQSESFMMMREDEAEDHEVYLSGPNQWPNLVGFREVLEDYHQIMSRLGFKLMKIALKASGAEDLAFMSAFEIPTTWLRLLMYPVHPEEAEEDLYGSAPHTDFGCLTLLAQDQTGGLQVKSSSGAWLDVPHINSSFVLNVGDMLHRLSNGRLLSTPHRVISLSGRKRFSCAFFYDANVNTMICPLIGTGQPRFEPVRFGDFLKAELQAGYDRHKYGMD